MRRNTAAWAFVGFGIGILALSGCGPAECRDICDSRHSPTLDTIDLTWVNPWRLNDTDRLTSGPSPTLAASPVNTNASTVATNLVKDARFLFTDTTANLAGFREFGLGPLVVDTTDPTHATTRIEFGSPNYASIPATLHSNVPLLSLTPDTLTVIYSLRAQDTLHGLLAFHDTVKLNKSEICSQYP